MDIFIEQDHPRNEDGEWTDKGASSKSPAQGNGAPRKLAGVDLDSPKAIKQLTQAGPKKLFDETGIRVTLDKRFGETVEEVYQEVKRNKNPGEMAFIEREYGQVARQVGLIPKSHQALLAKKGLTIELVNRIDFSDARGEKVQAYVKARGKNHDRPIMVVSSVVEREGRLKQFEDRPEAISHELGHAVDIALGEISSKMKRAFAEDTKLYTEISIDGYEDEEDRQSATEDAEFITSPSEWFAEIYSVIYGEGKNETGAFQVMSREDAMREFPKSIAAVKRALKKAGLES